MSGGLARWQVRLASEEVESTWREVVRIANGLVSAGYPAGAAEEALLQDTSGGARFIHIDSKGRPRSASESLRMARKAVSKAVRWQANSDPVRDRAEACLVLHEIRLAAEACPRRWTSRAGASDRAVLLAAVSLAESLGRLEFDASLRGLADRAHVSVGTARQATRRLQEWLRRVERGSGTAASRWRLVKPRDIPTGPEEATTEVGGADLSGRDDAYARSHDVFCGAPGGLGKSTLRVYEALGQEPVPSAALGPRLGIRQRTVNHHLRRLATVGLAVGRLDGWVRGSAELNAVAEALGIAGHGARQAERHRLHTQLRRDWIEGRKGRMTPMEVQQNATG